MLDSFSAYKMVVEIYDSFYDRSKAILEILRIAQKSETQWLEFKASFLPKISLSNNQFEFDKDEVFDDYYFNIVKAIVAISNTHGGLIIVGLDDNCNSTDLKFIDHKMEEYDSFEKYNREIILGKFLIKKNDNWVYKKSQYIINSKHYRNLFECKVCSYEGKNIILIFVKPVPKNEELICVLANNKKLYYYRTGGMVGQTRTIPDNKEELDSFIKTRNLYSNYSSMCYPYKYHNDFPEKDIVKYSYSKKDYLSFKNDSNELNIYMVYNFTSVNKYIAGYIISKCDDIDKIYHDSIFKSENDAILPYYFSVNHFKNNEDVDYILTALYIMLGVILPRRNNNYSINLIANSTQSKKININTKYIQGALHECKNHYPERLNNVTLSNITFPKDDEKIKNLQSELLMNIEIEYYKDLYAYLPIYKNIHDKLFCFFKINTNDNDNIDYDYLLDLFDQLQETKIYNFIIKELKPQRKNNKNIDSILLRTIDKRFSEKRDIIRFTNYISALSPFDIHKATTSIEDMLLYEKIKLIEMNYLGNQKGLNINEYNNYREAARQQNLYEIIIQADIQVCIYYNDLFEFDESMYIIETVKNDTSFNYLNKELQGKIFSMLGQILTNKGLFVEADEYYKKAIECFEFKTGERNNFNKTKSFRLLNSIRIDSNLCVELFNSIYTNPHEQINNFINLTSGSDPFLHYIFIKILYNRSEFKSLKENYQKKYDIYFDSMNSFKNHPWELIYFYKGLFLSEISKDKSSRCLLYAIEICSQKHYGRIIKIRGLVIALSGVLLFSISDELKELFIRQYELLMEKYEMIKIDNNNKYYNEIINQLKFILCDIKKYKVQDVLKLLPFSYQ